jgi:hypothetical protein
MYACVGIVDPGKDKYHVEPCVGVYLAAASLVIFRSHNLQVPLATAHNLLNFLCMHM